MRLADLTRFRWRNREQFFAIAARVMRMVLVDEARAERAAKRGGAAVQVTLGEDAAVASRTDFDLLALNDALEALAARDARKCQVVELRCFGGLTTEETARALRDFDGRP